MKKLLSPKIFWKKCHLWQIPCLPHYFSIMFIFICIYIGIWTSAYHRGSNDNIYVHCVLFKVPVALQGILQVLRLYCRGEDWCLLHLCLVSKFIIWSTAQNFNLYVCCLILMWYLGVIHMTCMDYDIFPICKKYLLILQSDVRCKTFGLLSIIYQLML